MALKPADRLIGVTDQQVNGDGLALRVTQVEPDTVDLRRPYCE